MSSFNAQDDARKYEPKDKQYKKYKSQGRNSELI